jgi:ArsR family transcriptional regulator, arsenate/arsenite/antimonite-responsive transcriptional repressor
MEDGVAMHDLIKAAKALSDETRVRMLGILLERECCVCEVMQALNISQSRASRNLHALLEAGFLKLREDGLWVIYSVDSESMPEQCSALINAVAKSLKGNRIVLADIKRLKSAKRVGHGCSPADNRTLRSLTSS